MPLYCKVSIKAYSEGEGGSDKAAPGHLADLQHEGQRLAEKQDQSLLFETPANWHKKFLDALLRPEDWARAPFGFSGDDVVRLCELAETKLRGEPTLLEIRAPIKVFGDIHGQYPELMRLFAAYGAPSRLGDIGLLDYLFLGDYVDRGEWSLETVCLLFALKVEFPTQVHLLRGNHEVRDVNERYGFLRECQSRLGRMPGLKVWERINRVFDWLPLAARIDERIFCTHGGISESLVSCCQIVNIPRPLTFERSPTGSALLAHQLLWNDPNEHDSVLGSHASSRGARIHTFSAQQVEDFCQANELELIIRAHQCVKDGFERFARGRLVTVFSAANYCGEYDNAGALLVVGRDHVVVPKLIRPQPSRQQEQGPPAGTVEGRAAAPAAAAATPAARAGLTFAAIGKAAAGTHAPAPATTGPAARAGPTFAAIGKAVMGIPVAAAVVAGTGPAARAALAGPTFAAIGACSYSSPRAPAAVASAGQAEVCAPALVAAPQSAVEKVRPAAKAPNLKAAVAAILEAQQALELGGPEEAAPGAEELVVKWSAAETMAAGPVSSTPPEKGARGWLIPYDESAGRALASVEQPMGLVAALADAFVDVSVWRSPQRSLST